MSPEVVQKRKPYGSDRAVRLNFGEWKTFRLRRENGSSAMADILSEKVLNPSVSLYGLFYLLIM